MKSLKLSRKTLRSDLVSEFATGLFSIPEGMAYARLARVDPVYGLYSGMITTIVASLTTGSILMISTLTSSTALSTASVIQVVGIKHSQICLSHPRKSVKQLVRTQDGKYEERNVPELYPANQATVVVFEGNRFFAEVPFLEEFLPSRQDVKNAMVILRARPQKTVPGTALKWLKRYTKELHQSGNLLILAGVEPLVMQELHKAGLLDQIGKENIYASGSVIQDSLNEALDAAGSWMNCPAASRGVSELRRLVLLEMKLARFRGIS